MKQKKILTEVALPQSFKHTLLSASDIDKEIIVVDGAMMVILLSAHRKV